MTDHDLAAIERRAEKAHSYIADLCAGKRRWTMTVPVDLERDDDIVLSNSIRDVDDLIAELRASRERERELRDVLTQMCVAAADALDGGTPDDLVDALDVANRPLDDTGHLSPTVSDEHLDTEEQ